MTRIVVVGAGQAGASLVAKLRSLGFAGTITLIGEEPVPPYQRPPLSKKYLLGELEEERLYLRPMQFYADNNIGLRLETRVTAIDAARRIVTAGGDAIPYDHLVLTTGGRARTLPAAVTGHRDGIHLVRTLADVDRMAPEFISGRKALILGGGYIGLEAAAVAALRGLDVTLLSANGRILRRVASEATADYFRSLHQRHGVHIREGVGIAELLGTQRVTGAVLTDGSRVEADFLVAGIGLDAATELAQSAELTLDNGIAVDDFGRTSDPAIWAAGDCTSFPFAGGRIRLESVQNAIDQAERVAENMLGAAKPYVPVPWFWSDQYEVKLQIAGLSSGHDQVVVRGAGEAAQSHWYWRRGQFIAVDAMNDARGYMVGKRLLEAGRSPDPAVIADPSADLKTLLR
ncbi:pyridine nucleotide-disulfide oxidoreductase [Haematobacter massiliensis]|uniref:Pyridine nucleotide-disulfide oxidoreductase n=1 Tax=Haematobacter massiliensis TaxID=195105 RepID=A0A086YA67_9RHOB|nr:FAD-dependent oxidoreductase [Haematobacter massiliensis]KFI31167.1 pyridine nucleotide-disulfide oxidoreductase [Haematobacter massiliensis]OWJ69662.1 pyridine nucleotide-disulfide oxidoreductase [Haematobacter massiliensis]OWJ83907.1 pyridine nucleotide-disulfide oxidoreductase [Haematobacter massiliensis]QBJ23248.1 pyridine nucleotide-disulfide oxidoreductase [Haematobacter massiliensis]